MTAEANTTKASPRQPKRRTIRQRIRKTYAQTVKSIHNSIRYQGAQVIDMCHHDNLSPSAMPDIASSPQTAAPASAPNRRRAVARVSMATITEMARYMQLKR